MAFFLAESPVFAGLRAGMGWVGVTRTTPLCAIPATGTAITKILPPASRFSKDNNHSAKKQTVLDKLAAFFERYFGLG